MNQAFKSDDTFLYGDGQQAHNYCDVGDPMDGFFRFSDLPARNGGSPELPGPICLGNRNEFSAEQSSYKEGFQYIVADFDGLFIEND